MIKFKLFEKLCYDVHWTENNLLDYGSDYIFLFKIMKKSLDCQKNKFLVLNDSQSWISSCYISYWFKCIQWQHLCLGVSCFLTFFGGQLPGRKLPTFLYPYRRPFLYPYSHQFHRKVRRVGISYLATKMKNICIIM